jgi:hypothetical protein
MESGIQNIMRRILLEMVVILLGSLEGASQISLQVLVHLQLLLLIAV